MKLDPSTGPIPRDEFKALIDAPCGEATKVIRKYDPLFGRQPGDKIKWEVTFERDVSEIGYAIVEAESEKEAEKIADNLSADEIEWEPGDSYTMGSVMQVKAKA